MLRHCWWVFFYGCNNRMPYMAHLKMKVLVCTFTHSNQLDSQRSTLETIFLVIRSVTANNSSAFTANWLTIYPFEYGLWV